MTAVGGSIESVSIRGRMFPVAADAEASKKMGGFENEIASNGDGTGRIIKTRVPWLLDGVQLVVDDNKADAEFLQEIADGKGLVPITITFASGRVFQGSGTVQGEVQVSSQSATATVALAGPGGMTQQ